MSSPRHLLALTLVASLAGASAHAEETSPAPIADPIAVPTPAAAAAPAPAGEVAPVAAPTATPMPAPAPVAAPAAQAEPSTADGPPRPSWKMCAGFGAGAVVALLSGAVLGGLAKARESEQRGDVAAPVLYTDELASRGREGERMATAAYVLLAVGAAAAVVDVVLWVERLRKAPRKKEAARAGLFRPNGVAVSPRPFGLEVSF